MRPSHTPEILADAVLPLAKADLNVTIMSVFECNQLTLGISFAKGSATSQLSLRVKWLMRDAIVYSGVIIVGGALVEEVWPFLPVGLDFTRVLVLDVPPGAQDFAGAFFDSGDAVAPGHVTCRASAGGQT